MTIFDWCNSVFPFCHILDLKKVGDLQDPAALGGTQKLLLSFESGLLKQRQSSGTRTRFETHWSNVILSERVNFRFSLSVSHYH